MSVSETESFSPEDGELPESWKELSEWLRYPGKGDDVEQYVWELANQFECVRPATVAGVGLPPAVKTQDLVAKLLAHYKVEADEVDDARDSLTAGIEMCDLDFV